MTTKKLLLTSILGVAIAFQANAYNLFQTYIAGGTNTLSVGGTNAVVAFVGTTETKPFNIPGAANSTNKFPAVEFVPGTGGGARLMPIQLSFAGDGASTGNVVFHFASSIDGANWKSDALVVAVALNGTANVVAINALDTSCVPLWSLTSIVNSNAVNVTNMIVNASINTGGL